ncbi:MAG: hypothetical protein WBV71_13610, partial [Roseobacter sp.]
GVMKIIGIPAMIDTMKAQEASLPPKSVPHCSIRPRGIPPAPKAIVPAERTTPRQNAYNAETSHQPHHEQRFHTDSPRIGHSFGIRVLHYNQRL